MSSFGISKKDVALFVATYGEEAVRAKMALLCAEAKRRQIQNPSGWLFQALKENFIDARETYAQKLQAEKEIKQAEYQVLVQAAKENLSKEAPKGRPISPESPFYAAYLRHTQKAHGEPFDDG